MKINFSEASFKSADSLKYSSQNFFTVVNDNAIENRYYEHKIYVSKSRLLRLVNAFMFSHLNSVQNDCGI